MVPRPAGLNAAEHRVHKRRVCKKGELQDLLSTAKRPFVFMDIEGAEDELLDLEKVPALIGADVIAETHDAYNRGVTWRLIRRFSATHRTDLCTALADEDRQIPDFVATKISDPAEQRSFVSEWRHLPQLWVRFLARTTAK